MTTVMRLPCGDHATPERVAFDPVLVAANAPARLRERPQWVCWKYIQRDGKETKCPVNPHTGSEASSTDPATWGSFEQAMEACHGRRLAGVGYVFAADDPYCGVDLDDAIDPASGELKPWGQQLVDLLGSYTEISPSAGGVKVFLRASKPGTRCRKGYHDGEVEIYDRERFFTVTGQHLPGTPPDVHDRQTHLEAAYYRVFPDERVIPPPPPDFAKAQDQNQQKVQLDDDEIIRLAWRSRSAAKFAALWNGQWQEHFPSASEADSSLVFRLGFYTKDAAQLDRLFRRSGLMREKWDERHGEQTYGQITIVNALKKVTSQYDPQKKVSRPSPKPARNPDLPAIVISDIQLSDLTAEASDALKKANQPPVLFVRAGTPVRVVRDEAGIPTVEALDRARMRCRLAETANFFNLRKGEGGYVRAGTNPPLTLAENILALGRWEFPPLAGIAQAPILRADGSVCTLPGYDSQSRLIYCPEPGLVVPEIPELPSSHEVDACIGLLLSLIDDFPFADEASRANALAILFSILMRPVIRGHIPLAIIEAPVQGTGKTLLVNALGTIAVGSVASESIPSRQNEDEWRKKITSILRNGWPFVLLDNIADNTTIDSSALAAALTSHEWSDRLLGRNDSIRLPSRVVWAATGNNLRVAGDMPRRSYSVRLDANSERPWERTGFRIGDLDQHIARHRGDLLSAAFTIIRGWYAADRPQTSVPAFGSFEEWAGTIGSILAYAGIDGFLSNLGEIRAVQDEDTQQWSAFFEAWWKTSGAAPVTVDELCKRLLAESNGVLATVPDPLLVNRDRGEGALHRSLGRHLSRLSGRIFGGRKLGHSGGDAHRKVRAWCLRPIGEPVTPLTPRNPAANPAQGVSQ